MKVAVATTDKKIIEINILTCNTIQELQIDKKIKSLYYQNDDNIIAVTDSPLGTYNLITKKFIISNSQATDIKISPNKDIVAIFTPVSKAELHHYLTLYDESTGKIIFSHEGIEDIFFSPYGDLVVFKK